MYIAKQGEDKSNKVVWEGNPEGFIRSITPEEFDEFPVLRGIALYEDTYFNSQQIAGLIEELKKLQVKFSDQKDKDELESLISFASTVELQEHLVFVGD